MKKFTLALSIAALALSTLQVRAQKTFTFSCGGPSYSYTGSYQQNSANPYPAFIASHPNSGVYVVGPVDGSYNCHAFAWPNDKTVQVQTYGGATQAPEYYYNVGCYVQTTQSDAEIVVYGNTASPIHSAIRLTNSTNGFANTYLSQNPQYAGWFVSKWDGGPVVIHSLDSCPYYFDLPNTAPTYYKKVGAASGSNRLKGSNYSITGPKAVCTSGGGQFTLSCGTPKSFTVTWSCSSNINLTPNANAYPVTATATGGTGGWIKATLNFPDGTTDTVTRYPVWIGPPTYISSISTSQWTAGGVGYITITVPQSGTDFYGWPGFNTGDLFPPNGIDLHGASSYSWSCSGLSFTQNPSTIGCRYTAGYFSGYGAAILTLSASNACGSTSNFQSLSVQPGGFRAALSPNPASGQVRVTISDNTSSAATTAKTVAVTRSAPGAPVTVASGTLITYTVRVIDIRGAVLYTTKKTGNDFTIPTGNLKSGNYVVEISDGRTVSSKPLVISK